MYMFLSLWPIVFQAISNQKMLCLHVHIYKEFNYILYMYDLAMVICQITVIFACILTIGLDSFDVVRLFQ
jgi:hypothetical protein